MKKVIKLATLLFILLIVLYFNKESVYLWWYIVAVVISVLLAVLIYFFLNKLFHKDKLIFKMLSIFISLVGLSIIFIMIVCSTWSGFHSASCYNLSAKNIFTGSVKEYCNFPPWYTRIEKTETEKKWPGNMNTICEKPVKTSAKDICQGFIPNNDLF